MRWIRLDRSGWAIAVAFDNGRHQSYCVRHLSAGFGNNYGRHGTYITGGERNMVKLDAGKC